MAYSPSQLIPFNCSVEDSSANQNGVSTIVRKKRANERPSTQNRLPLKTTANHKQQTARQTSSQANLRSKQSSAAHSQKQSQTEKHSQAARHTQPKPNTRPATLAEQLKHCLAQYELLQKQVLCAELMNTASADDDKFERTAEKLVRRIGRLRSQLAERSKPAESKRIIKLSVGHSTAMVLKAFADAGKKPAALVERALWADADVQDAALLLNLKAPKRRMTASKTK